jgi:hypothetical protein
MDKLESRVKAMKLKEHKDREKNIMEMINQEPTLTRKCVIARDCLTPQSTSMEKFIMTDLNIEKPVDNVSGDGSKNGENCEIKFSGHAKGSKFNFVQIRPDHNIDYYIFVGYNMHFDDAIGKAYIFKIPSCRLYELVVKYGGYAHGTNCELGKITLDNMKGRNCEYALRCDPNAKKGKSLRLWNDMLKYKVTYEAENF